MALQLGRYLHDAFDQLRFEPVGKRIRVHAGGTLLCDTSDAVLVWEPRHPVPLYAVPERDLDAELTACDTPAVPAELPPVVLPGQFGWHLHDGQSLTVSSGGRSFEAAAYRPADPDLDGLVLLDWEPFSWAEEAMAVTGHPHDPFHRVDAVPSDRHVVVTSHAGDVLADSRRPVAVFETHFPTRWYLPREDVDLDLLEPSETTTVCAYKGVASYFSLPAGERDVAWTYVAPMLEAVPAEGHLCFDPRHTDLTVT